MKAKTYNPPPLVLNEGFFFDLHYKDYEEMLSRADNWEHYCTYQLRSHALKGNHKALQLHSMQIAYVQRPGGMMNEAGTAKGCLTFAVLEESAGKACFDRMKLKAGDIVFFDDKAPYNFMTSDAFKLCAVNMQKEKMGDLLPLVSQAHMHRIQDTDGVMSKTLRALWKQFTEENDSKKETKDFRDAEEEIRTLLSKLLKEQIPVRTKLTKGEEVALSIRDQVYAHMDGKISVSSLAEQYGVSAKTLQNSFKSLFGFSPNYFLRQLKLNLVHNELKKSNSSQSTVSKSALKWGFTHMGRFSSYYTELFGENPSQTLKKEYDGNMAVEQACVSRKEEIM